MRRAVVALLALCVHLGMHAGALGAQAPVGTDAPPPPGVLPSLDSARAIRGAPLEVALLTYGPGDVAFEKFGHVALAIRNTATGQDVAYNWGMFDFDQPNFYGRFLTGDTRYWMLGYSTSVFNAGNIRDNRSIRRQTLALSPVERAALLDYVVWNSEGENRFYRYDYYRDNCSTRIRDALDRVTNGRIRAALAVPGTGRTWRGETERAFASSLPLYAGIELALGRNADRVLSQWDEAFLPEHMANGFETLVLRDDEGRRYRFVSADTMLFTANRIPLPSEPPDRVLMAALLGLTLAGLIAVLADADGRGIRVVLSVLVALWYFVCGVAGTLLLLAGTVTKHIPYMGANTTLLQMHPLLLVAAVAVPIALVRHTRSRVALGVSMTIALLSLAGALLQLMPAFRQHSGVVLAVTVPVHLALALAVWRLDASPRA